jgi:hypothetical protein
VATARAASRSLIPAALGVVVAAGVAATLGRQAAPGGERGPMIAAAVGPGALGVIVAAGVGGHRRSGSWGFPRPGGPEAIDSG